MGHLEDLADAPSAPASSRFATRFIAAAVTILLLMGLGSWATAPDLAPGFASGSSSDQVSLWTTEPPPGQRFYTVGSQVLVVLTFRNDGRLPVSVLGVDPGVSTCGFEVLEARGAGHVADVVPWAARPLEEGLRVAGGETGIVWVLGQVRGRADGTSCWPSGGAVSFSTIPVTIRSGWREATVELEVGHKVVMTGDLEAMRYAYGDGTVEVIPGTPAAEWPWTEPA